jgi:Asp-tRNA(Asn)/Glu-tRNA(Gln) amidotransferase A subunit family amidase
MKKDLLGAKTIKQAMRLMKANVFTAQELCDATIKQLEECRHLNAYVSYADQAQMRREAEESQLRIEKSKNVLICR